jgi:hypothetical protein|tara:strand:+ start:731 stop:907 length:177 start_codon:yes stop_codon:yes gene_type:complete
LDPLRVFVVQKVQVIPSEEVKILPESPTDTKILPTKLTPLKTFNVEQFEHVIMFVHEE